MREMSDVRANHAEFAVRVAFLALSQRRDPCVFRLRQQAQFAVIVVRLLSNAQTVAHE